MYSESMGKEYSRSACHSSFFLFGYTLIEILIVAMVMTLLFTVGYANYRDFQRRQIVTSFAKQIEGDLRLAQEYALGGRKPTSGCTQLDGYEFEINLSSQTYDIYPRCDGSRLTSIKSASLPPGVTISSSFPSGSVNFRVLGKGAEILGSGSFPASVMVGLTQQITSGSCAVQPWRFYPPQNCGAQWLHTVAITITQAGTIQ